MARLSAEAWADLALSALAEEGPEALTVARLCERAGKTRGSLYHHFANHEAVLRAVVGRWHERDTRAVAKEAGSDASVLQRLSGALDVRVEQGVRRLAARHPFLEDAVAAADAERVAALVEIHSKRHAQEAAQVIAEIEYAAFLGFQQLSVDDARRQALYIAFERLVATASERPS